MGYTRQELFSALRAQALDVTFDDIRLATGYSDILPEEANLETIFTRNVKLKIPLVSAAMDTVTEAPMAIVMALLGGIGVIHKAMKPQAQAAMVRRVRTYLNGLISNPTPVLDTDTIASVKDLKRRLLEEGLEPHSFPALDSNGKLIGLLTREDIYFCMNDDRLVSEVIEPTHLKAPKNTTIQEAFQEMLKYHEKALPLHDDAGMLCGMYAFSDVARIVTGKQHMHNIDEKTGQLRVAAAVGTRDFEERAELLVREGVDVLVIDTAHGDSRRVYETLAELKRQYPDVDIMVGNVSEGESARRLADAGADGIKVGQGGGSICTTRVVAGVGCPQCSALHECSCAVEGRGIGICSDGGARNSGDLTVALALGSHSVMAGRLFAGTDEAPGTVTKVDNNWVKEYRGMGSVGAMKANAEAMHDRYQQKAVPEGIESVVPYQGKMADVIAQLIGGVRAGMGYTGARTIEELHKKATFRRASSAGIAEGRPHDVIVTKQTPNYRES
jgi:IMP dehydrogenase